jgi:hypothetical protein
MDGERSKKILSSQRLEPLLSIGFGNTVAAHRVVAIVTPSSAPMRRLKDEAKADGRLVDATCGRKTRSIIVMDSNHIVLSAVQAETVSLRYAALLDRQDKPLVEDVSTP